VVIKQIRYDPNSENMIEEYEIGKPKKENYVYGGYA